MVFNRDVYYLSDRQNRIQGRIFAEPGAVPEVEPWMVNKIQVHGWDLTKAEVGQQVQTDIHGRVNWAKIAEGLAEVLRAMVDDSVDLDLEDTERLVKMAAGALTDYDVAHMEINLGNLAPGEESTEQEEDSDAEERD